MEKRRESGRSILSKEIIERRAAEIPTIISNNDALNKSSTKVIQENDNMQGDENDKPPYKTKKKFLVDTMFPQANRSERKLLSETLDKIFVIIQKSTDKKTAENIINKIREELK